MSSFTMQLPRDVRYIITALNRSGYRADVVGGAVRDALLGKTPSDFDITTNARPNEIKAVFENEKTVDSGISHGTVALILNGSQYEITTYRIDGEYKDNRHPVSVSFSNDILNDLARRDFTVNALAYNDKDGLTDAFCGERDLREGVIRAVGEPALRFSEDALRILRAIRFAAVLGFDIEEATSLALEEKMAGLDSVSVERITVEWYKLLSGESSLGILEKYRNIIFRILPELSDLKLPKEKAWRGRSASEREIMLFALNSDAAGFEAAKKRLKSDRRSLKFGSSVLKIMEKLPVRTNDELSRIIAANQDNETICALSLAAALEVESYETYESFKSLTETGFPTKVSMLDVSGDDILRLGFRGEQVGKVLSELLMLVLNRRCDNTRNKLISAVKLIKKQGKFPISNAN